LVVWNAITSTDTNKLERIQQKLAFVCFYHFFPHVRYTYTVALEKLSLHSLCKRRHDLDALFFIQVYRGLKSCTSLLENASLQIFTNNLRVFSLFGVCASNKHCPARCAYAANAVGKYLDIFAIGAVSLNHIYTHESKSFNIMCSIELLLLFTFFFVVLFLSYRQPLVAEPLK
jgi:hypothetical protein